MTPRANDCRANDRRTNDRRANDLEAVRVDTVNKSYSYFYVLPSLHRCLL